MYTVHHYNFGTRYEFTSFAAAREWATKAAFEALVRSPAGDLLATYSPITGWRVL